MVAHAHFSRLSKELYRLWKSELLLDTTVRTSETCVNIHKIILIIFSSFWRDIFSKDSICSEVQAAGYSTTDIQTFLKFLYDGESQTTAGGKAMEIIRSLKLDLTVDQKIRKKKMSVTKGDSVQSVIDIELKYLRTLTMEMEVPKLLKSVVYSDVQIRTGKHIHHCQKVILAAFSSYFQVMFSSGMRETQDQVVTLQGVDTPIFSLVLSFIYTGSVAITTLNAQELLCTAVYLQIQSLQTNCEDFLLCQIDVSNCVDMWKLGGAYSCQNLVDGSVDFIVDNFSSVPTSSLDNIDYDFLISLIKSDNLNVESEKKVLDVCLAWVSKERSRETCFEEILGCVRLSLLTKDQLTNVLRHSVFKRNEVCRAVIESTINSLQDPDMQALPRKEKVFMILKTSSYVNGIKIACYSFRQQKWFAMKNHKSYGGGAGYACCMAGNCLYISGGTAEPFKCLKFSVEENSWSSCPGLNEGRSSHSMESVNGSLYVLGGVGPSSVTDLFPVVNSVEMFEDQVWKCVGKLTIATSDCASASVKNNIFLIGGTMNATMGLYSKDIQCFNTVTNTCTVLYHHLPMTISMAVAVTNKKDIFIACPRGEIIHFNDDTAPLVLGHVHRSSVMGYGAVYHSGFLFILGGHGSCESDAIYKFDLEKKSSSVLQETKLPFLKQSNLLFASVVHITQSRLKTEYKQS